jgi:hypothetical protein
MSAAVPLFSCSELRLSWLWLNLNIKSYNLLGTVFVNQLNLDILH